MRHTDAARFQKKETELNLSQWTFERGKHGWVQKQKKVVAAVE